MLLNLPSNDKAKKVCFDLHYTCILCESNYKSMHKRNIELTINRFEGEVIIGNCSYVCVFFNTLKLVSIESVGRAAEIICIMRCCSTLITASVCSSSYCLQKNELQWGFPAL